jgi:hypothetical protein
MKILGYWGSQEQYSMQDLTRFVIEVEKGGFTATMTSDHFHPLGSMITDNAILDGFVNRYVNNWLLTNVN